jgi:hypothetical protein
MVGEFGYRVAHGLFRIGRATARYWIQNASKNTV